MAKLSELGISNDQLDAILDYVIEQVVESEDYDDLRRRLGIDPESKLGRMVSRSKNIEPFNVYFLQIAARLSMMEQVMSHMSKVHCSLPEVAMDMVENLRSYLKGNVAQLSLDSLINEYDLALDEYITRTKAEPEPLQPVAEQENMFDDI